MLVTCRQMQQAEERAFAAGATAADLMEAAGEGIAAVVRQFFPRPGSLVLYLGSGNNGGDALVAARHLRCDGWRVFARLSVQPAQMKELPRRHLEAMPDLIILSEPASAVATSGPLVLLDGLLGIGSQGEMRPSLRALAVEMNALRRSHHARVVAMDIPSGLNGDTGTPTPGTVEADVTAVVAQVKIGLVADAATPLVGRICLVPLPALTGCEGDPTAQLLAPALLRPWLPRRSFDLHKGQAGRVGVIAGSRGFLGAAVLVSQGALRGGAGLVTLLAKEDVYPLIAGCVPPEVMVKPVADYREALDMTFDAIAIGPGLGFGAETEALEVITRTAAPAIVDADALTMLARVGLSCLGDAQGPRLLTPHPGEMVRLTAAQPALMHLPRRALAEAVAAGLPGHAILYKGARTVIAAHGEPTRFNSTGHPGMATGGMGDLLTGVCAALAGQGVSLPHAAGIGAWLCGRAAELAALDQAPESVLPSDVARHLGFAWRDLTEGVG